MKRRKFVAGSAGLAGVLASSAPPAVAQGSPEDIIKPYLPSLARRGGREAAGVVRGHTARILAGFLRERGVTANPTTDSEPPRRQGRQEKQLWNNREN